MDLILRIHLFNNLCVVYWQNWTTFLVQNRSLTLVICPTKKTYVRVPRTSSDRSFQNSKEWVDTAIQIAGSKHCGTYEAAYRIANHLLRFYRDSFHCVWKSMSSHLQRDECNSTPSNVVCREGYRRRGKGNQKTFECAPWLRFLSNKTKCRHAGWWPQWNSLWEFGIYVWR